MNNFHFKEKPAFSFSKKISISFSGRDHVIFLKNSWISSKMKLKINNDSGSFKMKKNGFFNSLYECDFNNRQFFMNQKNQEISINFDHKTYEFIFQKGLITGIFLDNKIAGIVKQKANVKFGLEEYHGIIEPFVPYEVLIFFLVLFNKTYSKEGYLFFKYKGFTSIKPRMLCDTLLIEKINSSF